MADKVLVVDDEPDILDLVELTLVSEGFDVVTATDGAEALAAAHAEGPDLVLLDVSMPDLDGFEVMQALRGSPTTREIPVIMLTARAQISDKLRGLSSGADDYITKPFEPSDLVARVTAALGPAPSAGVEDVSAPLEQWSGEIEELARHLETAAQIQLGLMPEESPPLAGFRVVGMLESSLNVSGDFYDFIQLDEDRVGIAIADIRGKGIPAALLMVMVRTVLRIVAREGHGPAEALRRVNDFLAAETAPDMFATIVYGILDTRRREFTYCNGGHCYPLHVRASDDSVATLSTGGMLVGAFASATYEEETVSLGQGDLVALYTDGVTESESEAGEHFGEDRILTLVRDMARLTADALCGTVRSRLAEFRGGAQRSDDLTMVA
ncbi:fused response regulator/phosphatase, partial [Candidatus Poribacteria bacterium]|nr:fused response regulator/phosphatase [Candidatus Poribacteria bacterium]